MTKTIIRNLLAICLLFCGLTSVWGQGKSVYTQKPNDPEAFYFTPENYGFVNDGKSDVTEALQAAINQVKTEKGFGILFLPEGKYRISKTIHIPSSVRLIGYGKNRPVIYLGANTPGFQEEQNYMIWFTGGLVTEGRTPSDANAGTFYSGLSNVDMRIDKGNPKAIAIRSHFAQHGLIAHVDLHIGKGYAGIWDVGNELEDVNFFEGDYGIISVRPSPGWPVAIVDTYFEKQRQAAILSKDMGSAIIGMQVKNVPYAFEMAEGIPDRLHLENSLFENVSKAAIKISIEDNTFSQVNIQNLDCKNVPTFVEYAQSGKKITVNDKMYRVNDFAYGLIYSDLNDTPAFEEICDIEPLKSVAKKLEKDLPQLPGMEEWVNIRDLGAKGDGVTDDSDVFEKAIAEHKVIYVPQGWYRLTRTLKMAPGTKLIGLHPFGTQFILNESEPAFSGFGSPVALVESSEGGDDILNGIGINTGAYNYRAVGVKWMAGADSYMNDIKYVGGHGTLRKPAPAPAAAPATARRTAAAPRISSPSNSVRAQGMDLAWDKQYWSLWVTNGGGGTFKDIWTASTYAASGLYVNDTETPGRIYAMSLEHHVRSECRFDNVANWKIYAFQFEEEGIEGPDCFMGEMTNCRNVEFFNIWFYRVIRAYLPKEIGFRLWNCEDIVFNNMHNFTQVLPVTEFAVYDMNKKLPVNAWEFARLTVTGKEKSNRPALTLNNPVKLAHGIELATGAAVDSKGNVYFCETRLKKIYKWDAQTNEVTLLSDYPWKPLALAVDTEDNLLVICRYDKQPGYAPDNNIKVIERFADNNGNYSGWGNGGWAVKVYAIDLNEPDGNFEELDMVVTADAKNVKKVLHPSSRWRGNFDETVVAMAERSFVAPDGATIIPETFDLCRATALVAVAPGQREPAYIADENIKTTYKYDVAANGQLQNQVKLAPFAQYSTVVDAAGNVYVADGAIYVYNKDGKEIRRIQVEERPISLAIGGANGEILIATTHDGVYGIRIK